MERVKKRQDEHARPYGHAFRLGDQTSQGLERRKPNGRAVGEVMADDHAIKASLTRHPDLLKMVSKAPLQRIGGWVLGIDEEREPHPPCPPWVRGTESGGCWSH
jgi:hypothetical protein